MSSFDRRSFLIAAVALTGCGFEPVYGPDGGAKGLLGQVQVDGPTENYSYILVRELEDRLGTPTVAKYGLTYAISIERRRSGVTIDGVTNRYELLGEVTYALRDQASNRVLTSGKVDNFTGYSTSGNTVTALAGETDAQERLMTILADLIVAELQIYATQNPL